MAQSTRKPVGDQFYMVYDPAYAQAMPRAHWDNLDEATAVAAEIQRKNDADVVYVLTAVRKVVTPRPAPTVVDITVHEVPN